MVADTDGAETVAGLTLLKPDPNQMGSFARGLDCWGNLLQDTQFDTVGRLESKMADLDVVAERPVFYTPKDGEEPTRLDAFKAVVSKKSGRVYSVPSKGYAVVQDRDVARPLLQVCRDRKLVPIGRIDGAGSGRTVGHVFFANPEFHIQLLKAHSENILVGVRWWNSYTTDMSYGGEIVGIRMVCVNYNLWGTLLGRWRLTHKKAEEHIMAKFEGLLESALNASTVLRGKVEAALATVVARVDIPDLLWGIALPVKGIDAITDNVADWAPEVVQRKDVTAWDLYNAATAYITYRKGGGVHLRATEEQSRKALDLLTAKHDDIIVAGRKRKEAYEGMLEAEKEKAAAARVKAAPVAGKAPRARKVA